MENRWNTVICALNSQYIHSSLAPWCLLAGVNAYGQSGITAQVIEGTINDNMENVAQRIIAQNPRAVGFCCYIWNITATQKLIRLVKDRLPDTVVILGGPEVSYNAEAVLREEPLVNYIISGEGEKPFALLLNALYSGENTENIPGVCSRCEDGVIISEPYIPQDEPPTPYTPEYFHALNGRIAYLETSRGCPYSCAFCLSGRCGNVRFFDLERAKKEMLLLANSGAQTVKLVDRTFNANRKRSNELFQFIIKHYGKEIPAGVCFHFEIAGDLLDDETLRLLSTAPVGAMQLEIGLQSFYDKTLEAIHRKTDVEHLKRNIVRLVANGNMHIHIDLIAGLPYEDLNRFAQSFNTAYVLRPNMLQLGFLKLLYGAPMREQPEAFPCSYSPEPPYEVTETPWLSRQELQQLHRMEDALERLFNSGRFRRTLEYVLKQSDLSPFELFSKFGEYASEQETEHISLDDYTALAYEYFGGLAGVDKKVLRDVMVCDRLATNSTGRLPAVLRVPDSSLKTVVRQLANGEKTRALKGVKRGVALLYSERCAVYADYVGRNPVTGEYPLTKIPLESLH